MTKEKYQRSAQPTPTAEAIEDLGERLEARFDKLEERLNDLNSTLESVEESFDSANVDFFAEDVADIQKALQEPIVRAALRGVT